MIEYFPHDYKARTEPKMRKLFMEKGLKGLGLYWCLVEMLYEENGYIHINQIPVIAFDYRVNEKFIEEVLNNYDLFKVDGDKFYSNGVIKRLKVRDCKSEIAKTKAFKSWENRRNTATAEPQQSNGSATAEPQQSKCNAIKLNKIKLNKIKLNTKESKEVNFDSIISEYTLNEKLRETLFEFIKMRQRIQKALTNYGLQLILGKIDKLTNDDYIKIQIVNQSIERSWQGVFPLKEETKTKSSIFD